MSCDYAKGLSPYPNKGVLGAPEKFDSDDKIKQKCSLLTEFIKNAKRIVVHTGAGISTSAGIPDFRGPNGVWTLEEKGLKPEINISFKDARPTKTHMALKKLADENVIHYIVTQNIDGLHLKSGLDRSKLAQLHGDMFVDQCNACKRQYTRSTPTPTVGQRYAGLPCPSKLSTRRGCRGKLHDTILDWEHSLPDDDLEMAEMQASIADLSICLGTTLQIVPSGNIPLNTLKYGGKLVICNLQPTKHDNKADLIINTYVDDILEHVMKELNQKIPEYNSNDDPTSASNATEWTMCKVQLSEIRLLQKNKCNGVLKKRVLVKSNQVLKKPNYKKIKNEEDNENEFSSDCVKKELNKCTDNSATSKLSDSHSVDVKKEEVKELFDPKIKSESTVQC